MSGKGMSSGRSCCSGRDRIAAELLSDVPLLLHSNLQYLFLQYIFMQSLFLQCLFPLYLFLSAVYLLSQYEMVSQSRPHGLQGRFSF